MSEDNEFQSKCIGACRPGRAIEARPEKVSVVPVVVALAVFETTIELLPTEVMTVPATNCAPVTPSPVKYAVVPPRPLMVALPCTVFAATMVA